MYARSRFPNLPFGVESSAFIHNSPPLNKAGNSFHSWRGNGHSRSYPWPDGNSSPARGSGSIPHTNTNFLSPRSDDRRPSDKYKPSQLPIQSREWSGIDSRRPGQLPGEKTNKAAIAVLTNNQQADQAHEPYAKHIRRATSVPCNPAIHGSGLVSTTR